MDYWYLVVVFGSGSGTCLELQITDYWYLVVVLVCGSGMVVVVRP